jgi:hypothetical protein
MRNREDIVDKQGIYSAGTAKWEPRQVQASPLLGETLLTRKKVFVSSAAAIAASLIEDLRHTR